MAGDTGKRKRDGANDTSEHQKHSKRRQTSSDEPHLPAPRVVKDKIRDIKRLLAKSEKLPADVRVEKERELQQYESDLAEIEARKKRSAMIGKYHFVRFLERKTASKALNRLKKQRKAIQDADGSDSATLKELDEKVRIAEIDFNYTINSPLTEKYISLYPKSQKGKVNSSADAQGQAQSKEERAQAAEKPPLWHVVEQCMADNTLEDLREGKLDIGPDGKKNQLKPMTTSKPVAASKKKPFQQEQMGNNEGKAAGPYKDKKKENRKMRREKERDMKNLHDKLEDMAVNIDQGEESEGGFFEE